MRVLVIDDDPGTRGIIRLVLHRDFRAEVAEADHGLDGLARLEDGAFDLVVLDLQMPVMNGLETLEAIRRSDRHADVPVLVLTGEASAAAVRQVLALGISGYLTKPVNLGKLSARIAAIRDGGRQPLATAQEESIPEPAPTLVVVDGDAGFRLRVRDAFEGLARVVECGTGGQALQVLLGDGGVSPPRVVLIGTATGMLGGDLLARKVRTLALTPAPRIVAATPAAEPGVASGGVLYDAFLDRAGAPGTWVDALGTLLR